MHDAARETRHHSLRNDDAAACRAAGPTPKCSGAKVANMEQMEWGEAAAAARTGSTYGVLRQAQKTAELHAAILLAARVVVKRAHMSWGLFRLARTELISEHAGMCTGRLSVTLIEAAWVVPGVGESGGKRVRGGPANGARSRKVFFFFFESIYIPG